MTFTFTDGTITTSASEQTIVDLTANEEFAMWIFLHNMVASNTFRIRVYVKDQNAGSMRTYIDETISGVLDPPSFYIAPIITKEFKVTIQRTAGADKAVTWQTIEVT